MEMTETDLALVFKALGDVNRIRILKMLRSGETCACRMLEALEISQPTLSHHMKLLCDTGIVTGRKEGKWIHYSINSKTACQLRDLFMEVTADEHQIVGCSCEKGEKQ